MADILEDNETNKDSWTCDKCHSVSHSKVGHWLNSKVVYCLNCGHRIGGKCPACRKIISIKSKSCTHCDANIEGVLKGKIEEQNAIIVNMQDELNYMFNRAEDHLEQGKWSIVQNTLAKYPYITDVNQIDSKSIQLIQMWGQGEFLLPIPLGDDRPEIDRVEFLLNEAKKIKRMTVKKMVKNAMVIYTIIFIMQVFVSLIQSRINNQPFSIDIVLLGFFFQSTIALLGSWGYGHFFAGYFSYRIERVLAILSPIPFYFLSGICCGAYLVLIVIRWAYNMSKNEPQMRGSSWRELRRDEPWHL